MLGTGGADYFGTALVKKLIEMGATARIFDLSPTSLSHPRLEAVQGDIREAEAVVRTCQGVDIVHHNVAQQPLAKDRALIWSVTSDGTRNILEAVRIGGARKVIYTSSTAVYGVPESNPVTEATTSRPRESYGRAKVAGEQLCKEYRASGLDVTVIRPRTVVGGGRLGIFQILFEWIYQNVNIPMLDPATTSIGLCTPIPPRRLAVYRALLHYDPA